MSKPILLYYQNKDGYRVVFNNYPTIEEANELPRYNYNCFYLQTGYEPTDEGLLLYQQQFFISVEQLKEIKTRNGNHIDYTRYFSHNDAVLLIYFEHLIGTKTITNRSDANIESIDYIEAKWINRLNNGGLTYFDKTKANTTQECYGYDFKSFYPTLLGKYLKFPTKRGIEKTVREIPLDAKGRVQFGYYRVYIFYTDENFHKLFSLSKDNTYSNYSLDTALNYQNLNLFGVKINVMEEENNAYIYEENTIISSTQYFDYWYKTLMDFKQKYPKNCFIKHLLSSFWGHLCQYNKIYGDEDKFNGVISDDLEDEADFYALSKNSISKKHSDEKKGYYIVCPKEKIYKYNLARIKPFLVSLGRNYIERMAIFPNIDKVLRIYTDGIVFLTDSNIIVPNSLFVKEEKTTGTIHWTNLLEYKKV